MILSFAVRGLHRVKIGDLDGDAVFLLLRGISALLGFGARHVAESG